MRSRIQSLLQEAKPTLDYLASQSMLLWVLCAKTAKFSLETHKQRQKSQQVKDG